MKTLDLQQGEPAWFAHRATARNASDASAVLGCSPYTTRAQLLQARHTGIRPEVDAATQRRFDAGHAIEQAQLPGAEEVIGQDLYPAVGVEVVDGIELSASFDGITMDESTAYECKTLNEDLRSALSAVGGIEANDARNLPKHYRVQMEQQLMVCSGERVLFVAADAAGDDVRRCWYTSDPALRAEILAAWRQFDADLAAYEPKAPAAEKVVAEPVEALPAPVVTVSGQLTLQDNFKVFEQRLRDFIDHRLIRQPKTDEDFVNLDAQIKAMKRAREALNAAEAQMLAQVAPVDQAKKTKDMLDTLLQQNVSMAERLLTAEKDRRKGEIVAGGVAALKTHIDHLNKRLAGNYIASVPADFGGAIRGLKSLASMEDKVGGELARAKIAANELADRISINLAQLGEHLEFSHLFPDTAQLVLKSEDDCKAVIEARIAKHKAEGQRRAEAAAEKERERIRAEEERKAREKIAAEQREQQEREAAARREQEAAQRAQAPAPPPAPARAANEAPAPSSKPAAANSPVVVPINRGAPTLRIGEIANRLGFGITEQFLRQLGFAPAGKQGAACLFHEESFDLICEALVAHVRTVQAKQHEQVAA